jgi:glutamine synthetase
MLAAGLEGIRECRDPGEASDDLSYATEAETLPRTLIESVAAFESDPLVHEVFHERFITEYAEMKSAEWERNHAEVTDLERSAYLLNI